ncbi:MAG: sugar phosphate isomerase/epimerase [Planctomycetes bacterium]|nr:sugar phosphate isomerase/epimerase [Planctomycetota bacterium]
MPATTKTGSYPIGFRQGWSEWQKDVDGLIAFARDNGFAALDFGPPRTRAELQKVVDAGLKVGTIDPVGAWSDLASPDAGKRAAAAQRTIDYVAAVAPLATLVFSVAVVEDHARARAENFRFVVDGYGRLCEGVAKHGVKVLIEGWPGGGPHYSSIGCTPADYRALLKELPANAGINFDPSHLVRMGIDPLRFVDEFSASIHHVHGKDTELLADELYEHGNLQPATFAKGHGFGAHHWRYCVPGRGSIAWKPLFAKLAAVGYRGLVSIELEDEEFNTDAAGEQRGLIEAKRFLSTEAAAARAAKS